MFLYNFHVDPSSALLCNFKGFTLGSREKCAPILNHNEVYLKLFLKVLSFSTASVSSFCSIGTKEAENVFSIFLSLSFKRSLPSGLTSI